MSPIDSDDDEIINPEDDDFRHGDDGVKRRRTKIKTGIYGLQALLLQLAYDNALILIHRPILALRKSALRSASQDVYRRSVNACWEACLRISNIGRHHIFNQNSQVHAISQIGIHLFTAGVLLSAFAGSEPLSRMAWEAKQGLNRAIRMQRQLRTKTVVSGQSLSILETLTREVLKKEEKAILAQDAETQGDGHRSRPLENPYPNPSQTSQPLAGGMSAQTTTLNAQGQYDLSPVGDAIVDYSEGTAEFAMNFDGCMDNDLFDVSLLGLNESMLDIEKCTSSAFPL